MRIERAPKRTIGLTSIVNGVPPPPFPNSVYQTVSLGQAPLQYGFYLWDRDGSALVAADFEMTGPRIGKIVAGDGRAVGSVRVQAPQGATNFGFLSTGPSQSAAAFLTGVPTALLRARFEPDPEIVGDYVVTVAMTDGTALRLFVRVTT